MKFIEEHVNRTLQLSLLSEKTYFRASLVLIFNHKDIVLHLINMFYYH